MNTIPVGQEYLSLAQLSLLTGLSKSTLTRRFKEGKLPGYQPGGPRTRLLFPPDTIVLTAAKDQPPPLPHQVEKLSGPTPKWKQPSN